MRRRRVFGLVGAAACATILGFGVYLDPDERGYGTHKQLGQPACGMLVRTGYPCPGCGMTTSVSAMMHGQVGLAWRAQPFGIVLAVALAGGVLAGSWAAVTGRTPWRRIRPRLWWVLAAAGLWAACWAIRLAEGIHTGRYPLGG